MQEKDVNGTNTSEGSKPETVDFVINEYELRGVTPEMLAWWSENMNNAFYKLWHPAHISFEWEVPPFKTGSGRIGSIRIEVQKIGEFPARESRHRTVDPAECPISTTWPHVACGCTLGPDDEILGWGTREYKAEPWGTRMRAKARMPADRPMPQDRLDTIRQHMKVESERLAEFLPELYSIFQKYTE